MIVIILLALTAAIIEKNYTDLVRHIKANIENKTDILPLHLQDLALISDTYGPRWWAHKHRNSQPGGDEHGQKDGFDNVHLEPVSTSATSPQGIPHQ